MTAALQAGEVVELESANTIADGTAVKAVGVQNLPYVQENVDDILLVEDDELIGAFLDMVENHKMIVENSGLHSVATIADEQGNVIKLEHNQFVSTNRNAAVELRITMEAFGTEHKHKILNALEKKGFRPKLISAKLY